MKYWGGSGSNTGTKNFSVCSSEANLLFSKKYSWCKMISLSTSSTKIHIASEFPWIFSSHWKSGVITSSTLNVDLHSRDEHISRNSESPDNHWWPTLLHLRWRYVYMIFMQLHQHLVQSPSTSSTGVAEWFRALDLKSKDPWFKSSTISGFVLESTPRPLHLVQIANRSASH